MENAVETRPPPASVAFSNVVGVVGGMGPAASAALYRFVVEEEKADDDAGHVPLVIHSNPQVFATERPVDELVRTCLCLWAGGCTTIAMACNAAHAVLPEMRARLPPALAFLNMIELCCDHVLREHSAPPTAAAEVSASGGRHCVVGLLCATVTRDSSLFQRAFAAAAAALAGNVSSDASSSATTVEVLFPDEVGQAAVQQAIDDIKRGGVAAAALVLEREAAALVARGARCVVTGCTDMPLAFGDTTHPEFQVPIVDPMRVLARAIVHTTNASRIV